MLSSLRQVSWLLMLQLFPVAIGVARAEVSLPKLIGSGMVLQRDVVLNLWGSADPGEEVVISFRGNRAKAIASRSGEWSVTLGPYNAGGPYSMTIAGKNTIKLTDVLIGDVWLASGQSNMEVGLMPINGWKGVYNAEQEIAMANFPQIRLLRVQTTRAATPQHDAVTSTGWTSVSSETIKQFSAVAYFFGRELHERYQTPVGIIMAASGGTVAEAWMSAAALKSFPEFDGDIKAITSADPNVLEAYEKFARQRTRWYEQHGAEDRGQRDGVAIWADPKLDVTTWPNITVPRNIMFCGTDFEGFGGVVWFRRTFSLTPEIASKNVLNVLVHLGTIIKDDVTYLNGIRIGETQGTTNQRTYTVPPAVLHPGENTIAVRVTGTNGPIAGCAGIMRHVEDGRPKIDVGEQSISLVGDWSYQTGPNLEALPVADAVVRMAHPSQNTPTVLFNGMISPLLQFRIKGVIWYQGESNAIEDRSVQYRTLFPALITDWRSHWGYELPFCFVQLAGFGGNYSEPSEYSWADMREAQYTALALPNTAMASAVDIGEEDDIHPQNKQEVAHRLLLAAARVAYGEDVVHSGPTYRSLQKEDGQMRIRFSNVGSGLVIKDRYGYIRGFQISDAHGRHQWAQARLDGSDIVVFNRAIRDPVAVRYAWSNTPDGNVFNQEGLPAVPFRTDAPYGPFSQAVVAAKRNSGSRLRSPEPGKSMPPRP